MQISFKDRYNIIYLDLVDPNENKKIKRREKNKWLNYHIIHFNLLWMAYINFSEY